jgi:hypothetical protein
VEKYRDILNKALETRDLSSFFTREKLAVVLGGSGEGINGALELFRGGNRTPATAPAVLRNRALTTLDEEWYGGVEERIRTWAAKDGVNQATLKRFGRRWVRNLGKNMGAIRDFPGISRLGGIMAPDIPVFLAAAGPGLDETASLLPAIYRRCLIVAVDTSLRFLLSGGIEPDFVVSVDPQYWNYRHLDRQRAPRTRLVAESAVYPPCLRGPFGGVFLCSSLFPLGRFIEDRLDPKGELGAGGSVATTAWDFARSMAPPSIWIGGLDLSFPGLKTHFRGALFEDRVLGESGRTLPAETWVFRGLREGRPFPAPAAGGGKVLTDRRLSLYAAWFENRFRRHGETANFSLSSGGLAIEGLHTGAAGDLLALKDRREEINARLDRAFRAVEEEFRAPEAVKSRALLFEDARRALLDGLGELKTLALEAGEAAETGFFLHREHKLGASERDRRLEKLDRVNRRITESAVKDVAGFLFPDPAELEQGLKTPAGDKTGRFFELSAALYKALHETVAFTLDTLTPMPQRPPTHGPPAYE